MASVEQLSRSQGSFIKVFLPFIKALATTNDPYMQNEAAAILERYATTWGLNRLTNKDNFAIRSKQETFSKEPFLREAANKSLLITFQRNLNSMDTSQPNFFIDYYAFIELFFKLINPIKYFRETPSLDYECVPDYPGCNQGTAFFGTRIGFYKRPQSAGGTPAINQLQWEVIGSPKAPIYFTLWDVVGGTHDVISYMGLGPASASTIPLPPPTNGVYNYLDVNTGPVYTAAGYANNLIDAIMGVGGISARWTAAIDPEDDALVIMTHVATGEVFADPSEGFGSSGGFDSGVQVFIYTEGTGGGGGGADDTMYASDGSLIPGGPFVTDTEWQNAHNIERVSYELSIGVDMKYLLALDLPYPPGPAEEGLFLQTNQLAVINQMPKNMPGVIEGRRLGIKVPVTDVV